MNQIEEIQAKIDELKGRWPAHSVPPNMWQELEELEDQLEKLKNKKVNDGELKK